LAQVTITGVAGFLGSHLANRFLAEGWKVKGVDSLIGGYASNVPKGVEFYGYDLASDVEEIEDAFTDSELVIHAACTAYEGLSVFSPSLVVKNTVQASINALTASQRQGVKKFIYLSSMARYGSIPTPYNEDQEPSSQDPYGIAKLASEKLVRNLCNTHGMDWVILVPHNIIGPRQKYDDPFRNVASIMTNRLLKGKPPIIYGDGEQMRCFSFIQDVVEPLWTACHSPKALSQVINIGPDEEAVTINQLAQKLQNIIGTDFEPIYTGGRPQEVKIALCSSRKARELLNYQTSTTLEEGLTDLVNWIRDRGTKEFEYHLPIEIHTEALPETWARRWF
jgi:UDP-glucose 4-epimerase